jgi:CHAD domain-containing protein
VHTAAENEAKFEGDPATAVPALAEVADGAREVELATVTLTATYYDTADLRLLRSHLTLRHRRDHSGTGEDGWTLKVPGAGAGGPGTRRMELTWPGAEGPVPDEAVGITAAATRGAALQPVAQIVTVRRRREIRARGGERLAEIDDDQVTATNLVGGAGGEDRPEPLRFREVEVEVDAGDDSLLDRAARHLADSGFAPSADASKLHRVLAARVGPEPTRPAPGPGSAIGEVVKAGISGGLDRLMAHDLAVRINGDPRGIHQVRVAIRRLRSDLRTFRPLLDPDWVDRTRTTLKWVADALGDVRDTDVLAGRLATHRSTGAAVGGSGFDELTARLDARREAAMVNLRDVLHRPRYLELLDQLEQAASSPPWRADGRVDPDRPAASELGQLVRRPWRRLRKAVDGLEAEPDDRALHRVRIKAKQVRYAAETAKPVIGRPAKRLAKGAKALQGTLGDHNDAVDAEAWLRQEAAGPTTPVAVAAGGAIALERQAQAGTREAWPTAWRKVSRRKGRRWLH